MSKTDETGRPAPSRRGFLRTATAGTAAAALGLGATGTAAAQDGGDFDGWMSDVGNYDGTVTDRTGQDSVTIEVGAQGNGGGFAFAPPAVRIDPGTTVTFEWTGEGGQHNVVAEEGADFESELTAEAGFTFEHTFESEGTVKYYCSPHRALGMKGVVVVGGSGGGGGSESQATPVPAEYGDWFSDVGNYDGETVDERGTDSVTVEVGAQGNGGGFAFAPPAVRVSPGTTVTWEWTGEGGQHNVVAEEGADFESELTAEAGFTFEHTFEEPGVVTYYCDPHRALGMKGAVVVDPSSPGAGGEGGGEEEEGGQLVLTPGLTAMGGAIILGILSPIIFAVLLAFRRGSLGSNPEAAGGATGERLERVEPAADTEFVTAEAPVTEPETTIEHDEFDPTGTAGMIIVYFLILVLLWIFMYFVEFLGNGPTIIG
jgi:halocyanin-like protein